MIGYDNLAINRQIALDLPFREASGLITHDVAKPHHIASLAGHAPVWGEVALSGLGVLEFNGTSQYLEIPAADTQDLDFTGDFALAVWIHPVFGACDMLMCRSLLDNCGWEMYIDENASVNNYLSLRSNQAGSRTGAYASDFTADEWQLVGFDYDSATSLATAFKNGLPKVTTNNGGILDPIACGVTQKLLIGVQQGEISNFFKGKMWRPRAWPRKLGTAGWAQIFEYHRHWLGV